MYVHGIYIKGSCLEKIVATENTTVMMTFRLEKELREAFDAAAQFNDQTSSQLLRQFMREYVKKHAPAMKEQAKGVTA